MNHYRSKPLGNSFRLHMTPSSCRPPACLTHPAPSREAAEIRALLKDTTSRRHKVQVHFGETQSQSRRRRCHRHRPPCSAHVSTSIPDSESETLTLKILPVHRAVAWRHNGVTPLVDRHKPLTWLSPTAVLIFNITSL